VAKSEKIAYYRLMLSAPFYDPLKSYEENYAEGPFNGFADGVELAAEGEPRFEFCGVKINYPLGIPAGPLLNSAYVSSAFQKGFDVPVYKTVRSDSFPCHPFPNVLAAHIEGDLTLERARTPLVVDANYTEPLSITNSFGVPSRPVALWQEDAKKAVASARNGQVMVMSFMGTVREGQSADEFVSDFARAAELSVTTGAKIFEANLSCPNIGNEGLVCYNLDMTERVTAAIREKLGELPLILKVGYYTSDEDIAHLAEIAQKYAHAVSSINTIAAPIVGKDGTQALPGSAVRMRSGVCGAAIKWAGLEMSERLAAARAKIGGDFKIVGVGGVTVPKDYKEYRDAGADLVMSATGAMWNPYLARDITLAYPAG
jgi:dihydroorotate dehydrogenase (NAD+) catalytic subunit